jgi:Cation transport ATPase
MSAPMLTSAEQRSAARQLTLAMLALGLLTLGLVWRWLAPDQTGVSQLLLGVASLLVAVPVMRSAWYSLRFPSLHGITDQLIALAMLGAWATGDLLTAALLPIIMIFGHVLEERSVIGSQEAIHALGKLTRSHARRVQADGSIIEVDNGTLSTGDIVEVRAGDRVPADGVVLSGAGEPGHGADHRRVGTVGSQCGCAGVWRDDQPRWPVAPASDAYRQ